MCITVHSRHPQHSAAQFLNDLQNNVVAVMQSVGGEVVNTGSDVRVIFSY